MSNLIRIEGDIYEFVANCFIFGSRDLLNWMDFNGRTARTNGSPAPRSFFPPLFNRWRLQRPAHTQKNTAPKTDNCTFTRFLKAKQTVAVKNFNFSTIKQVIRYNSPWVNGAERKAKRGTQRRIPLSGHHSEEEKEKHFVFILKREKKLWRI